eukprot:COSAG06_NODE_2068_length_7675_cov_8.333421_4_plen_64_part_00
MDNARTSIGVWQSVRGGRTLSHWFWSEDMTEVLALFEAALAKEHAEVAAQVEPLARYDGGSAL